jgi:hypothetical protein
MRVMAAALLLSLFVTAAGAFDLSVLAPCKAAAERLCDRSAGMTWSNLLRCGATLAANQVRVGYRCRQVLRKYGQL